MDLRMTFNEIPGLYDKLRPTYVPGLFKDIFEYSSIDGNSRVLEIGIGTGQATLPFLEAGCHVAAIELGDDLADFSRNKFKDYLNFEVLNMAFEDYEGPDNSFDIIYCASAFHWIPEEVGYPKVFRLIKSGGTFARFANHPYKDKQNEPIHFAFQELYEKYMQSLVEPKEYDIQMAEERSEISKKFGFVDQEYKLYHRIRNMDSENYANLIKTYSDHITLGEEKLEKFSEEIKEVISKYGGIINIYDTIDLQLARKP